MLEIYLYKPGRSLCKDHETAHRFTLPPCRLEETRLTLANIFLLILRVILSKFLPYIISLSIS